MTVYIDILIILNILVNYFMLAAVKKISRSHTSRLRLALGALSGGVASLLIFIDSLGIIMTLLKIAASLVMVFISFGFGSVKQFFKRALWLFFISFVFGGLVFAVYMCFGLETMIYTNGIVYFDVDMTFLVVCSAVAYALITLVSKFIDKKAPKSKEYYVTLQKNGKNISCTGFMDTGNNLREPFSGFPVIMVCSSVFRELMGGDIPIEKMQGNEKIRLIPISTVSGNTIIKAFRPDSVKIGEFTTDKVYVGESLTHLDEYKIILNINLERELQNE
ncbi:MAG: sigma-E processing peptidase SpoIIGA [Oscillospiraceae bacterium]|nr:sigma-E processing peptidase SpoIIGA [Oscillospiraceae bacterium]